eukprot:TRINITY_DN28751_c0_g1_i1.p2 TRINITY_DN28751_c0_g1~~TRINITY_DN28751_c0_g1_i1.p2  ORF type:complete len:215 (+),score=-14.15 TRINITY_DN28751_c0_g1_i1:190-834(+)
MLLMLYFIYNSQRAQHIVRTLKIKVSGLSTYFLHHVFTGSSLYNKEGKLFFSLLFSLPIIFQFVSFSLQCLQRDVLGIVLKVFQSVQRHLYIIFQTSRHFFVATTNTQICYLKKQLVTQNGPKEKLTSLNNLHFNKAIIIVVSLPTKNLLFSYCQLTQKNYVVVKIQLQKIPVYLNVRPFQTPMGVYSILPLLRNYYYYYFTRQQETYQDRNNF